MRNLHLILVLAAYLLPLATAQAAPVDLPETGQTRCTDAAGAVITCANTGQDGDLKAGVAWPSTRFVAGTGPTVGCVTDNLTGLMWVGAPSTVADTWANALTGANGLTLCGFSDWRLPNVNELESLVNSEAVNPATFLNAQGFSNVQAGTNLSSAYYWSSSSSAGIAARAWVVDMGYGYVVAVDKLVAVDNSSSRFFWPVRAGQ